MNLPEFKLFRFGVPGQERPAVELPDGSRLDVSGFGEDYEPAFFEQDGYRRLQMWLSSNFINCPPVGDERIASCIVSPSKIIAAGINYRAHANEAQYPLPEEPVLFLKSPSSLSGPFDPIPIPTGAKKLDWECELAVVIGRKGRYIEQEETADYIAGYAVVNDVSERHDQLEGTGQWTKGKSFDHFCPLGPYLVPPSQLPDIKTLRMQLTVDGTTMQSATVSEMVFDVPYLISYISRYMTLMPGDLLLTGTPGGVGLGQTPPVFLKAGDVIENQIDGLGLQRQVVRTYEDWLKEGQMTFE